MLMILAAMWGVVRKVMDFQFEMILLIVIAFDVEEECLAVLVMPLASNHRIPDCC